jgi:lipopolysaccharide/colanic/teichoic acid biosynthesis glycosyltransferase
MIHNAEASGKPQLSSDDDPRITPFGRFMRKYRIDELPQFWNVLKGEMAMVGPRPERKYYIDLITKRVPAYSLLHQVRPGITSMGMVKFGYAKNVDEMVERVKYDLMYLDNMSLINDLKILIYTVKIVFTGRGM